MKQIIKKILVTSFLAPSFIYAFTPEIKDTIKTTECLKVTGLAIDEKNMAIDGVEIKLFKQNDEMEEIEITNVEHHQHCFCFTLESNEYYTVQISKPGYVKRSVVFYTDLPSNLNLQTLFIYEFEVILFKEKKIDDYYLDFPIALIHFNKTKRCFENNDNYTKYIKNKIKEAETIEKNKKLKIIDQKSIIKN